MTARASQLFACSVQGKVIGLEACAPIKLDQGPVEVVTTSLSNKVHLACCGATILCRIIASVHHHLGNGFHTDGVGTEKPEVDLANIDSIHSKVRRTPGVLGSIVADRYPVSCFTA